MTHKLTRRGAIITASAAATFLAAPSLLRAATTHEVQMLSKHPDDRKLRNIFLPRIVAAEPGDTIVFLPTEKGHNSASAKDMTPEGAEAWKGKINEEVSVTLTVPGFYGYECTPHASLGMVGLVVVKGDGMMDNLETAKSARQRGKAKKVWEEIWAEVEEMGLMS